MMIVPSGLSSLDGAPHFLALSTSAFFKKGSMSYYRLRDIKTPPFAYILNREDVVKTCPSCQMPFPQPEAALEVEICAGTPHEWENRLHGQPMMADHWLIGDEAFGDDFAKMLQGNVGKVPVEIVGWLRAEPSFDESPSKVHSSRIAPQFFHYFPTAQIGVAPEVLDRFPPIRCNACQRNIPNIPFHLQPVPEPTHTVLFAALEQFPLDGFDYLFHHSVVPTLQSRFPTMLLEKLPPPSSFLG